MIPARDMTERGLLVIDIHILADKYDVPKLYKAVSEDLKRLLLDLRLLQISRSTYNARSTSLRL